MTASPTLNATPVAWMRVHSFPGDANWPPHDDGEFNYGADRPNGEGWEPLYRGTSAEQPANASAHVEISRLLPLIGPPEDTPDASFDPMEFQAASDCVVPLGRTRWLDPDSQTVTDALNAYYGGPEGWREPWRTKQGENSERFRMALAIEAIDQSGLHSLVISYEASSDLMHYALGEAQERAERAEALIAQSLPALRAAIVQLEDAWARSDGVDTSGIDVARQSVASKLDVLEGASP